MVINNEHLLEYVEGEIYEIIEIDEHRFEIICGYNNVQDKEAGVVLPIYPNFKDRPKYTKEGYPLATCLQDACKYYECIPESDKEQTCIDCKHFKSKQRSVIGICRCEERKIFN